MYKGRAPFCNQQNTKKAANAAFFEWFLFFIGNAFCRSVLVRLGQRYYAFYYD
jgi:hypothetical protein